MKSMKLILIAALFFSILAVLIAQNQLVGIDLEEVLTIEGLGESLVYQQGSVTTDYEGNIYITDLEDNSIKKFNNKGELIGFAGQKGEEPKEFQGPNIIRYYRGKIYVSEVYNPGIQVFDDDLIFKFEIPIPFTMTDFSVLYEDRIAISTLIKDRSETGFIYCIYFYDSKGNRLKKEEEVEEGVEQKEEDDKIVYSTDKDFTMLHTVSFQDYRKNYFMIAYNWKDKIDRYYKSGRLVWTRGLLNNEDPQTRREGYSKRSFGVYPVEAVYKAIALDKQGNLFILCGDLSENTNRDVYVLNKDSEFITTFALPEASRTIHIDRNNFLYSRSEDGKKLIKYAIGYIFE
ncbi:MAG: hypothetical protein GTO16_05185 [Candidatus Aminicenantes bacterium]|nr:hypothetical protein [Candidatus Aminicenantes bacterium]